LQILDPFNKLFDEGHTSLGRIFNAGTWMRGCRTKRESRRNPCFRTPRYGLLRCARNEDVAQSVRPIGTTGKSLQSLSIPHRKNIPLAPSGKSVI